MADADKLSRALGRLAAVGAPKQKTDSFTQKTQEFKLLRKLFEDGIIEAADERGDIHHSHGVFQKCTTQQFRSQFDKLKKEVGICTGVGVAKTKLKAAEDAELEKGDKEEESDEEDNFASNRMKLAKNGVHAQNNGSWTPHQVATAHENNDGVRICGRLDWRDDR